jgi:hypothetical protein
MVITKNIHAKRKMRLLGDNIGKRASRQRRANDLREVLIVLS